MTEEICKLAVQQNGSLLSFVIPELLKLINNNYCL